MLAKWYGDVVCQVLNVNTVVKQLRLGFHHSIIHAFALSGNHGELLLIII